MHWLSNLCGGEISPKNLIFAFLGFIAAVALVVAWGFLVAVVYTPYC